MEEKDEKVFKTPNDLKVNVAKSNGEVVIDEECCTMVSIILKNTGDIAASFFGAHNPDVIRVLEKSLKGYFKSIKKELKRNYLQEEEEVKLIQEDIPSENKWSGESVPDIESTEQTKTPPAKVSPATTKEQAEKKDKKQTKTKKSTVAKDKVE